MISVVYQCDHQMYVHGVDWNNSTVGVGLFAFAPNIYYVVWEVGKVKAYQHFLAAQSGPPKSAKFLFGLCFAVWG